MFGVKVWGFLVQLGARELLSMEQLGVIRHQGPADGGERKDSPKIFCKFVFASLLELEKAQRC